MNLSKPQAENLANYIESLRTELAEAKEYVAIAGERATAAESERDRYEEVLERMTRGIDANPTRVFDEGDAERGWQYAASILSIIEARVANALHPQGED